MLQTTPARPLNRDGPAVRPAPAPDLHRMDPMTRAVPATRPKHRGSPRPAAVSRLLAAAAVALPLAACDPISLTLFGVGTAAGVSHTLGGIAYKTFTAPQKKVSKATTTAMGRMGIRIEKRETDENGAETISATALERDITIVLEPLSPKATRMKSTARTNGVLMDQATATEIILQTEQALIEGK